MTPSLLNTRITKKKKKITVLPWYPQGTVSRISAPTPHDTKIHICSSPYIKCNSTVGLFIHRSHVCRCGGLSVERQRKRKSKKKKKLDK